MDHTERTVMLIGEEGAEKLRRSRVAVFGIGGVGGYVTEALARAGVGELDLIDNDTVSLSNINRQIIALHSTAGQYKTETAAARIADISPECRVSTYNILYLPETADMFDFSAYDYVVDAIDNVTGKLTLIERARDAKVPVISS
ncbi:MAG: ThiF family adenylyltransferase, partial [Oscillospiraceae bacterium]|nr:ThiF family adenylyltransferase [Oscillospiraceae bacterium]